MKKVVIFYISEFGGHSKAAENIREAFWYKSSQTRVININGLNYFYPRGEKVVDFIYNSVIKYAPFLWGEIYDRKKVVKNLTPGRNLASMIAFRKLFRIIKQYHPNCFVATQAFPCGIVADFKKKFGLKIPLIAVVTDYYPHRFWVHSCVDKYIVACDEAKEFLIREGVPEEKIRVLGIPISVKFLNVYPIKDIVKEFGFHSDLSSVLIMGGGLGIGPIEKISRKLDVLSNNFQMIVICGRNKKLYKWFDDNKDSFRKPVFYFSYINFVHKLMDFCDVIITKAGGITVSEALAKRLPMIIIDPLPGQEERNVNFLLEKGAIIRADDVSTIGEAVKTLLGDKKKPFLLKEKAKDVSFIDSSLRIVDLILSEIS